MVDLIEQCLRCCMLALRKTDLVGGKWQQIVSADHPPPLRTHHTRALGRVCAYDPSF